MESNNEKQSSNTKCDYTFTVYCSFTMQYTFSEDEVERDLNGDGYDADPTDVALLALEEELEQHLFQMYPIWDVDASADSASLIAVAENELSHEEQ